MYVRSNKILKNTTINKFLSYILNLLMRQSDVGVSLMMDRRAGRRAGGPSRRF